MQIRDVLAAKPDQTMHYVDPDATVAEAVARMVVHGIGSLVVMQGETLVGLITERDIVRGMNRVGVCLTDNKVSELMETEPLVADPDDSADYGLDVLTRSRASHLVVLEDHKPLGVVSLHDVARAHLDAAHYRNDQLKRYIRHWPE